MHKFGPALHADRGNWVAVKELKLSCQSSVAPLFDICKYDLTYLPTTIMAYVYVHTYVYLPISIMATYMRIFNCNIKPRALLGRFRFQ